MSIRRKGNRWEVRISTGAGNRIEQRLPPGASKRDAQALGDAIRRRLIQSATGRIDYTLIEALDRWEIDAQRLKSWPKDLKYRADVVREIAAGRTLAQIGEVADLLKRRGTKAKLAPASVNRYLAILHRVATLAFRWGWTEQPIAQRIELLPGEVRRTQLATPAQLRILMAQADHRLRMMMLTAALTGLRKGELMRLQPDMIADDAIVLDANTKTGKPRVIPLPPELKKLPDYLPWQLSYANARKLYERARTAAGLPDLNWHDLRRSYGTWLLQGGASLADVRDLLGHGDVKTTSIYLATARKDLAKAIRNLPTVGEMMGKKKSAKRAQAA